MVLEGLNWVTSPAAWCVEPLVSSPFSISRTSFHPALARWSATLQPAIPPPMTTTCLRMRSASTRVGVRCRRSTPTNSSPRRVRCSGSRLARERRRGVGRGVRPGPRAGRARRTVAELPGGLTNANYKVTTGAGCFVVRCWADDTGLLAIDRDNEYENSVRAAEVGVGAPVIAYLPEHNTMVVGFIEGTTMSAATLRAGDHPGAIAAACRRLHGARAFRDDFDMFETQPRYLEIVQARGFRLPERYLEFAPHAAAIRDAFRAREEATVPCNNDLLAENFILTPDGSG